MKEKYVAETVVDFIRIVRSLQSSTADIMNYQQGYLEEKIKKRRRFSRTVGAMMKSLVIYCEDRGSTEIFQIFLQTLTSEENPAFYRTDRQA